MRKIINKSNSVLAVIIFMVVTLSTNLVCLASPININEYLIPTAIDSEESLIIDQRIDTNKITALNTSINKIIENDKKKEEVKPISDNKENKTLIDNINGNFTISSKVKTISDKMPEPVEEETEEISEEENGGNNDANATISYASDRVISPYEGYITEYIDLSKRVTITVEQMDAIINKWLSMSGSSNSGFKNMGQAFIDASNITGYDPIFLLSLAATESGWKVSDLHSRKNNPYSINMIDENPEKGYNMGDTFYDGIVNGAKWIRTNFYDDGYTSLYDMIYGGKQYASSAGNWISSIKSIMDKSYKFIM